MKTLRFDDTGLGLILVAVAVSQLGACYSSAAESQTNTYARPAKSAAALAPAERLAKEGLTQEAIAELEKVLPSLSAVADKVIGHEMLGDLLSQGSMFDLTNAAVQYERALLQAPGVGRLHFKKARAMFPNPKTHPQAAAALKQSLELGYTNAEIFYLLGTMSKLEGESTRDAQKTREAYHLAVKQFQQALQLDPNHIPALGNMGDIAFNLEQYDAAARSYQHVVELTPEPYRKMVVLVRLAHTETRLGDFARAGALLDQAELARAKVLPAADPLANASLQLESLRILMYKVENSLAANKPSEAIASCEAIRANVAEASKQFIKGGFTVEQLEHWDQFAKETLQKLRK